MKFRLVNGKNPLAYNRFPCRYLWVKVARVWALATRARKQAVQNQPFTNTLSHPLPSYRIENDPVLTWNDESAE